MKPFEIVGLPPDELNAFLSATHPDPFRILGPHRVGEKASVECQIVVRALGTPGERGHCHGGACPTAIES